MLEDVEVGADALVGGVEGQGLSQAQQVFGYTRLMVAAFGLGAGWAALDRAIPYSTTRIQAGGPLSEKQGYTHKLIVPHAVRLEAARAYIEETAERIDAGEGSLNTEGAIAKYLATEAGNAAADAASRRSAATATPASTWSRRSSATSASRRSTRAPRRSWR